MIYSGIKCINSIHYKKNKHDIVHCSLLTDERTVMLNAAIMVTIDPATVDLDEEQSRADRETWHA